MTTKMNVVEHELCGRLVLQNGGTTVITTLPAYVGASVRAFMAYSTKSVLVDKRV